MKALEKIVARCGIDLRLIARLLAMLVAFIPAEAPAFAQQTPAQLQAQVNAQPWTNGQGKLTGATLQQQYLSIIGTIGAMGTWDPVTGAYTPPPPSPSQIAAGLGFTPVSKAGDTMTGGLALPSLAMSGGTPSIVNLYSNMPADYAGVAGAGPTISMGCITVGCPRDPVSGQPYDSQRAQLYVHTTTLADSRQQEFGAYLHMDANTGVSPFWKANTPYAAGTQLTSGYQYQVVSACTSGANAPGWRGGTQSDGGCSLTWIGEGTNGKTVLGVSQDCQSFSGSCWGMAINQTREPNPVDPTRFSTNVELDTNSTDGDHAAGSPTGDVYGVLMGGTMVNGAGTVAIAPGAQGGPFATDGNGNPIQITTTSGSTAATMPSLYAVYLNQLILPSANTYIAADTYIIGKPLPWKAGASYGTAGFYGSEVLIGGNVYTTSQANCISSYSGTGPSGTGAAIVDGNGSTACSWSYLSGGTANTIVLSKPAIGSGTSSNPAGFLVNYGWHCGVCFISSYAVKDNAFANGANVSEAFTNSAAHNLSGGFHDAGGTASAPNPLGFYATGYYAAAAFDTTGMHGSGAAFRSSKGQKWCMDVGDACLYRFPGDLNVYLDLGGTARYIFDTAGNLTVSNTVRSSTTAPTPGANCGTGAAVTGNSQGGVVTAGTGTVTACTLTLSAALQTPFSGCTLTPANATAAGSGVGAYAALSDRTTTSWTIRGTALAGAAFNYVCM